MSRVLTVNDPAGMRLHLLELFLPYSGLEALDRAREAEAWVLGALAPAAPEIAIRVEIPIEEPRHDQDAPPPSPAGADVAGDEGGQPPDGDDLQPGAEPGDDGDGGTGESGHPPPVEGAGPEGEDATDLTAPGKVFLWPPERREVLRAGKVAWTEVRKEQLRDLCAEGLETREIEGRMGLPAGRNLVHASAGRFGFTAMWREARDARRIAAALAPEPVEPPIAVEPVAEPPQVKLPAPPVAEPPDIDDHVGAALAADKPGAVEQAAVALETDRPGFPIQGRSMAEVDATIEPASAISAADPALRAVRGLLACGIRVTEDSLATDLSTNRDIAAGHLRRLIDAGIVERRGKGSRTYHKIKGDTWQGGAAPSPKKHGDRGNKAGDVRADARAELKQHGAASVTLPPELEAKVTRVAPPHDHSGGPASIDQVISYLRHGDDSIVQTGKGLWLVNGMETMNPKQLMEKANKRRRRQRLDLFELIKD